MVLCHHIGYGMNDLTRHTINEQSIMQIQCIIHTMINRLL